MENEIQKFTNFASLTQTAPALLKENKGRVGRAVTFGEKLLVKIQSNGMSKEIDVEINSYLVKLNKTLKAVKEKRTPITQLLNSVTKEFTGYEQLLDAKRPDTTWFKLQKVRNDFAKAQAEKARLAEEEKQLEINKKKELEDIKISIVEHVNMKFNNHVHSVKEGLRVIFNGLSLEGWNEEVQVINEYSEEITVELYRTWIMPYSPVYISIAERDEVMKNTIVPMQAEFSAELQVQLAEIKQGFVSEYPAKKNELIAIRDAGKKEKERLEKEAKERETKSLAELEKQRKAACEKERLKSSAKKEEAEIVRHFDAQQVELEKAKPTGYEITTTGVNGYLPIMNFWFEKEGKALPFDTMELMTIGRMKKFCEVYAHKFDEKIESPYLKYSEVYNQKAK